MYSKKGGIIRLVKFYERHLFGEKCFPMEENTNSKVKWSKEVLRALKIIGSVALKILTVLLNILITLLLILALMGIICGCAFAVYIDNNIDTEIDENLFNFAESLNPITGGTSQLYRYDFTDRTNRVGEAVLLEGEQIYGSAKSIMVEYSDIPENLINAFIAVEDKRFITHDGVDWIRTIGAFLNFFAGSGDNYGGSTITQQLIKNVTGEDDYRIQRKIQEIFWALDLEQKMDKTTIMTAYMNIVSLANGYSGVGAAAWGYFSKDVSELTLLECAAIAGITKNPAKYNPITRPEENYERRETVLWLMYEQGLITKEEYDEVQGQELVLNIPDSEKTDEDGGYKVNSWYTDMVINDVIDDLVEIGYTTEAANIMVFSGGLKIYTAIDPQVQSVLEEVYTNHTDYFPSVNGIPPQSSCIVIDPATGDVLGVAGARGEKTANRVQSYATDAVRPVGSSIKPIAVYSPAMEQGVIQWNTIYDDVPIQYNGKKPWPQNVTKTYMGLTSLEYSLVHSLNTSSINTLKALGVDESFDFLHDGLNFHSLIDSQTLANGSVITDRGLAALGLGQFNYGITLRELVGGYTMLANSGIFSEPKSYLKVYDAAGNLILDKDNDPDGRRIMLSEETTFMMTELLEAVVDDMPSRFKTMIATGVDFAGKTGTTQDRYDYTFVGYTPYYLCGVWYGYEYPKALAANQAATSASIWNTVMTRLHTPIVEEAKESGAGVRKFPEASSQMTRATYCADSGKLCTTACHSDPRGDREIEGWFVKGTEPTEYCETHIWVKYDKVNGGIAGFDCPIENTTKVALLNIERWFKTSILVEDSQYTWRPLPQGYLPLLDKNRPYYYSYTMEHKDKHPGLTETSSKTQYNRYASAYYSKYASHNAWVAAYNEWLNSQPSYISPGE